MLAKESKKEQILAAAITRFSHYGVNKTTMNEIADDLGMSKANLYYYYPDKITLVTAIIDLLLAESESMVKEIVDQNLDTVTTLQHLLGIKFKLMKKYFMLILNFTEYSAAGEIGARVHDRIHEIELKTIEEILLRGIKSGELVTFDTKKSSELYVIMIRGISVWLGSCSPQPINDETVARKILDMQTLAARHFIAGVLEKV